LAQIDSKGTVLVTGATGFIGRQVVRALFRAGWTVRASGRDATRAPREAEFTRADLGEPGVAHRLTEGIDAVIHLAARVHIMRDSAQNPLDEFRRANVDVTTQLAAAARAAGVEQFIYASSIKVHGESTESTPLTEESAYAPLDPYGISKMEAEKALLTHAASHFHPTILRLPLTYGPGVAGNFARLLGLIRSRIPLPLGSISNARSMLYVGNLVSAILCLLEKKARSSRVFLVSDGENPSTPELIRRLAKAMNRTVYLCPFPTSLLVLMGKLGGFAGEVERLTQSLVVDSNRIRSELGWTVPYTVDQGLLATVNQKAVVLNSEAAR
jgi:nucleoside-diphosphate-sugar epimerase